MVVLKHRPALISPTSLPMALAFAAGCASTPPAVVAPDAVTAAGTAALDPADVLRWTFDDKVQHFPRMQASFPAVTVRRGEAVAPLPVAAAPLEVSFEVDGERWTLDDYVANNKTAGLLVIAGGQIVAERYALGHSAAGRWESFSVAKSLSSTLVGAALADGAIESLDDPVTRYLPGLAGSGYDGVSVRQLLTMTSGVRWSEDYADPESDVARFLSEPTVDGSDPIVTYMARLDSEAAPGTRWAYNTGETSLVGSLVRAATGKALSAYLSEKVWAAYGMERDAYWRTDASGREIAGCCLSASLRDYGRFGLFFMKGAKVDGRAIVPDGWVEAATRTTEVAAAAMAGLAGYGYQWWTTPGPAYRAAGIFGQGIWLNPELDLVIVTQSAWDEAVDSEASRRRALMISAVEQAVARRAEAPPRADAGR